MNNEYNIFTTEIGSTTITATEDIINQLRQSKIGQNESTVYYDSRSDVLKVFLRDETGHTKKLTEYIDLYLSVENEIIGLTIHKIQELIKQKDII